MDAKVELLPVRTDQVPEHVINQVKSKSSLDCFQLFCIWHSPAVTLDLVKQVRQGIEQQRQTTPSSDQQHGCASCKKQGCQTASSSSARKKQREPKRGKTRSGTSTDPALQPDGIMVTNHLATLWRTLPTREKNVYRKLVPVLLRKQADSPPPTGQRDQLSKGGPEAQTTISLGKRRNSASKCQGKGDGLSPTLGGCGSITATFQGNASGPNSDVQVKGHTALAVAAAVHEARGNSLADILHSCSAANGHHHPVDKTLVDQLSSNEVVDDRKPKKVVTLPSSNSIEIPRSGSPVLLPSSVLSSSPQGIPGLISTKEMAISGLHTVDLDLHLSGSLSRKAKKKANKKNRQAALKKLEAGPKLEAKVAKATKHVRFARKAEVFTFERAQGGSAVPLQGAHPLTLGKYVATLLLPICSDEATATKENGSNEAKAPKPKKRHPCHGPKEEELTAMEEKQRIRILRNALGEQWEDQEEVRYAALDAKECQTIRNSRSRNCCDCGTGKNRASRCDTAKCACYRAGVGCHAEGGSYCQCNMRCCQNPDGRYQFKGAVVNKARKRQISDYWAFVASAEYNWSPKGQELLAHLGLIDWPEDEMDQEEGAATTAETTEVDNSTLGCEEELEA